MLPLNETSISENVLGKIIARKKVWLEKRMAQEPLETFRDQLVPSDRSLAAALTENKTNFIMQKGISFQRTDQTGFQCSGNCIRL